MEKLLPSGSVFQTVKGEWDVYFETALVMLSEIMRNRAAGKKTVMIVPVGPTEQYPILARLVNELSLPLHDVHFFNMDEYLYDPDHAIPPEHPLSFHGRMERDFYSQVRPELNIPQSQRHFPEPGHEMEYDQMLHELGGADLCVGGLGINGHIAFNEAAEPGDPITAEAFAQLCTRVIPVSRETRAINANGYLRGDLRGMPEWGITVGMKQILDSRSIFIALNREWQHGILRHMLSDPVQPQIPATFLMTRHNVRFCATESITKDLFA